MVGRYPPSLILSVIILLTLRVAINRDVISDTQCCAQLLRYRDLLYKMDPARKHSASQRCKQLGVACERMLDLCLARKSRDNMTVVVTDFSLSK